MAVNTQRVDAYGSYLVTLTYELEERLLKRAAQSWMLAHPPPPEYAGVSAPREYAPFCASRLIHQQCANLDVSCILVR